MVDTKKPGDKTLSVPTKTLTLKPRVEPGIVRQSFSHGRTKQVVVAKRDKRRLGDDGSASEPVVAKAAPRSGSGVVLRTLTEEERSARANALAEVKLRDAEERKVSKDRSPEKNKSAEKRFPLRPILPLKAIPKQNIKKAIGFRPTGAGPLDLLEDPPSDPYDPEQAELYVRIRAQLNKLKEDIPSQERNQINDVVDDFLAQPPFLHEIKFKKVLWLCGNALRSAIAKHDAVSKDEFHYSRLPPAVAESLRRPVQEWNIFVFGDDELRELDDRRIGPQERDAIVANIEAAKPLVELATGDRNITTEQAARIVAAGVESAATDSTDINAKQAQDVVDGTLKNLATQIVRRAHLFCSRLIDPRTDEDKSVLLEYKKGAGKTLGAATVTGAISASVVVGGFATPYAVSFFEFVAANASMLKEYFVVAFQGDQIGQIIAGSGGAVWATPNCNTSPQFAVDVSCRR